MFGLEIFITYVLNSAVTFCERSGADSVQSDLYLKQTWKEYDCRSKGNLPIFYLPPRFQPAGHKHSDHKWSIHVTYQHEHFAGFSILDIA